MSTRKKKSGVQPGNFETVAKSELPNGRRGKHHQMLVEVLEDLQQLAGGRAMRIPLADYPGSVADIRSAIHRVTKKRNLEIATSSDDEYFYLWKPTPDGSSE